MNGEAKEDPQGLYLLERLRILARRTNEIEETSFSLVSRLFGSGIPDTSDISKDNVREDVLSEYFSIIWGRLRRIEKSLQGTLDALARLHKEFPDPAEMEKKSLE